MFCLVLQIQIDFRRFFKDMPGANCAFFGCPTSRIHKLSQFKIPTIGAADTDYTKALKRKTREEWLRLILRTRVMTPELKASIETNNIHICELHFKPECILEGNITAADNLYVLLNIHIRGLAYKA